MKQIGFSNYELERVETIGNSEVEFRITHMYGDNEYTEIDTVRIPNRPYAIEFVKMVLDLNYHTEEIEGIVEDVIGEISYDLDMSEEEVQKKIEEELGTEDLEEWLEDNNILRYDGSKVWSSERWEWYERELAMTIGYDMLLIEEGFKFKMREVG